MSRDSNKEIEDYFGIVYNDPPKGRWIVVDIYRDAKRRGIYPPLFTDPEGDSCFSCLLYTSDAADE